MPLSIFEEKYSKIAPNPRNLAAGSLSRKALMLERDELRTCPFLHMG